MARKKPKKNKKTKRTRRDRALEESFKNAYNRRTHKGLSFSEDSGVLIMPMHELRIWLREKYQGLQTLSSADAVLRLCNDHERLEKMAGMLKKGETHERKEVRITRTKHSEGRSIRRIRRSGNREPDVFSSSTRNKNPKERRIQRIK